MRLFTIIILFLVLMLHPTEVLALIDPARAAAIDVASELEKKSLDAQYKVQLLQSTGHLWTRQASIATAPTLQAKEIKKRATYT